MCTIFSAPRIELSRNEKIIEIDSVFSAIQLFEKHDKKNKKLGCIFVFHILNIARFFRAQEPSGAEQPR